MTVLDSYSDSGSKPLVVFNRECVTSKEIRHTIINETIGLPRLVGFILFSLGLKAYSKRRACILILQMFSIFVKIYDSLPMTPS